MLFVYDLRCLRLNGVSSLFSFVLLSVVLGILLSLVFIFVDLLIFSVVIVGKFWNWYDRSCKN